MPFASFSNAIGVLPLPIASRIGPPVSATARASGALSRNVTVRSSRTSGEMTLAPNGLRLWTFLCGFQSRFTLACWASAPCATHKTAPARMHVFTMVMSLPRQRRRGPASILTQGYHRIDRRRAARGHHAGDERGEQQGRGDGGKGHRVGGI